MSSNRPIVSCITPTYNRSDLVREAIESNLAQTYPHWEMLIIDDQSEDDTWEVITAYQKRDGRIRCFKNPDKGANSARNLGIEQARGKYIAFLDSDDVNLPNRFESQVKAMEKSGSRFILSWYYVKDRSNRYYKKINRKVLTGRVAGFTSRWMIEKELIQEVGGFNPRMVAMQEVELSYRIAAKYTFDYHDDIVIIIYNAPDSISKGERGIRGKLQLFEEVGHLMDNYDKAYWYASVALNSLRMNKCDDALDYFRTAISYEERLKRYKRRFEISTNLAARHGIGLWLSRILARTMKIDYSSQIEHKVIRGS